MLRENTKIHIPPNDYDIASFLDAVKGKDLSEIISAADREALAAWRRAYREKRKADKTDKALPDRYEQSLEELILFLRTALPYRPSGIDEGVFEQFLALGRKVFDEKGSRWSNQNGHI